MVPFSFHHAYFRVLYCATPFSAYVASTQYNSLTPSLQSHDAALSPDRGSDIVGAARRVPPLFVVAHKEQQYLRETFLKPSGGCWRPPPPPHARLSGSRLGSTRTHN